MCREEEELTVCPYRYSISRQRAILIYVRSCFVAMKTHGLRHTCVLHGDLIVLLGEVGPVTKLDNSFGNTHY